MKNLRPAVPAAGDVSHNAARCRGDVGHLQHSQDRTSRSISRLRRLRSYGSEGLKPPGHAPLMRVESWPLIGCVPAAVPSVAHRALNPPASVPSNSTSPLKAVMLGLPP